MLNRSNAINAARKAAKKARGANKRIKQNLGTDLRAGLQSPDHQKKVEEARVRDALNKPKIQAFLKKLLETNRISNYNTSVNKDIPITVDDYPNFNEDITNVVKKK